MSPKVFDSFATRSGSAKRAGSPPADRGAGWAASDVVQTPATIAASMIGPASRCDWFIGTRSGEGRRTRWWTDANMAIRERRRSLDDAERSRDALLERQQLARPFPRLPRAVRLGVHQPVVAR